MEYIIIFENDHKRDSHKLCFCQWTGHEEALKELCDFMIKEQTHGDFEYGYSFSYSSKHIPQSTVESMVGVRTDIHAAGISNIMTEVYDDSNTARYNSFFEFIREQVLQAKGSYNSDY